MADTPVVNAPKKTEMPATKLIPHFAPLAVLLHQSLFFLASATIVCRRVLTFGRGEGEPYQARESPIVLS